jgi:prephenate dehydratase
VKRKILVLDAFTNGHDAALVFIKKQGWTLGDCEIVFCGSHANVFKSLIDGPAYAVVPIRNSIAREVFEVTENLARLREIGYELNECDRLELQINHCLLVPQHVENASKLESVISHEKAIQQCGKYLDSIGITAVKRNRSDSTGNAAKAVSKLGPDVKIGAIAPRAAAKEYSRCSRQQNNIHSSSESSDR